MVEAAGQQRISRLLIVEDDNAQRRTLTDVMRAEHFEVLCCGTAAEALQHVEKGGFGVAIVDLGLPDLPGAKLLEKIRAMSDQVRVIIHTGYGSFDSAKTAVNLGAFAYVEKLSDPAELIGHVHRAFQERLRSYADELEREIAKRKRAEEGLRKAHDDLEIRVSQRTSELATANEYLRTEITERRRTEEKLRDSRRQYQVLAEVSPVGVFHTDSEGNCLYVNEQWCKIAGMTAEEAQDEGWTRGVHPEDRERVFKEWYEAARKVLPFQSEYRFGTPDGATTWVLGQARPERDTSGEISGYVGTITDINERKRAEEALQKAHDDLEIRVRERTAELSEANERLRREITEREQAEEALRENDLWLRSIFASLDEAVLVVTPDKRIVDVNAAAETMFGYTKSALVNCSTEILHVDHKAYLEFGKRIREGFDRGKTARFEFEAKRKSGEVFPTEHTVSSLKNDEGKAIGIVSVVRDITQRKKAEEQARRQEAELAHASRLSSMGEMMSGLAHELNQPLGAICTYADACKRMLGSGSLEAAAETVDKLAGQAERAGKIIRRVQRFVRKGEPHRSTVDVNDIIRETIRMVELEARLEDIAIALDLCDRAPAVQGDPIQIQQVILNLLRNALDAIGQAGAGHHKVTIQSSMVEGVSVLVRVCDTGVGLDGEAAERIFDAFYTTKPDGMGMGLSISRSIVEAHGGKLHVTPNRERGATFHLLLPAKEGVRNVND